MEDSPPVPHILGLPVMVTLRVMTEWMTARLSLIYWTYSTCDNDLACDDGMDEGPPGPHILVLPVMVTLCVTTEWMMARPALICSSYL
jgi:hypothetical protein